MEEHSRNVRYESTVLVSRHPAQRNFFIGDLTYFSVYLEGYGFRQPGKPQLLATKVEIKFGAMKLRWWGKMPGRGKEGKEKGTLEQCK